MSDAPHEPDPRAPRPGAPRDHAWSEPVASPAPWPAPHAPEADDVDPQLVELGYVPPDPDEPPPLELWRAVGGVRPWGTVILLLSWALVFLATGFHHALESPLGLEPWGASVTHGEAWDAAWRLLASTFLHAGMAHLFFNATSLVVVGTAVESIFTRWRFWIVYALGGAAASLASLAWRASREHGASLSVGGSGAVFALGGALLVVAIRLRHRLAPSRARALAAALLYLVVPGFAGGMAKPGTDNMAHAAGLACGALLGALLPVDPRLGGRRAGALERVVATLCVLALAVSLTIGLWSGWHAGE